MKSQSQRSLLAGLIALGLILTTVTAQAAPEYRWKLAQSWPTNFPIFSDAVTKMADLVEKVSQGQEHIHRRLQVRTDALRQAARERRLYWQAG